MAPGLYPTVPKQSDIDVRTLWRFLQDPTAVGRLVNDENANTFLSDWLFPTTIETNGALLYEVGEGSYTDRDPEEIAPGAVYPRAKPTEGAAAFARVPKVGQDVPITDEALQESKRDELRRAAQHVGRKVRRSIDTPAILGATAAVTKTVAAQALWTSAGAKAWLDIMLAVASINDEDENYEADTVLLSWTAYAWAASTLLPSLPRESASGTINTGRLPEIAGLSFAPAKLPVGTDAMVLDRKVFGSRGFRRIPSPEYTGDPAVGIETWAGRDPLRNDQWLIRGRRPMIAVVREPRAARRITGTGVAA